MLDLSHYTPSHQAELEKLLQSLTWQETLGSGLLERARAGRIDPGQTRDFIGTVADQLLDLNVSFEPSFRF